MKDIDQSFGYLINYTIRKMRKYSAEVFRKHGLGITMDQWAVLKILDENKGCLTLTEIAIKTSKDAPTLTKIIDIICREGYASRDRDKSDKRKWNIVLSEKGYHKVQEVYPIVENIRNHLGQRLSSQDQKELKRILSIINDNINEGNQ